MTDLADLKRRVEELRLALLDARTNGLIYWEPQTVRGHTEKAAMLARIDALLSAREQGGAA